MYFSLNNYHEISKSTTNISAPQTSFRTSLDVSSFPMQQQNNIYPPYIQPLTKSYFHTVSFLVVA